MKECETSQIELVKRIKGGDMLAFHEIVELYKKKVYYIAYNICNDHHEAEDISQEVFIKVFRYIDSFRSEAKFSTWIYQVAVNTSIDTLRKYKKRQFSMETAQMDSLPPETSATGSTVTCPQSHAARNLLRQRLLQALPELSKKERTIFVMRYFNEFKPLEIAEILNLSINSIKTMLLRAKKKLRKKLAPYNHPYDGKPYSEVPYE
jgi:RNA polymerase sigma-70 factor, ECF subfamily